MKIAVFLADGFEEVEAIAPVDICRRAGIEVLTVSIMGDSKRVMGSHGIPVEADALFSKTEFDDFDMLVLPGGTVGTQNLRACEPLCELFRQAGGQNRRLAAICAAPSILGSLGLLKGYAACCYPGFESSLEGADVKAGEKVVTDRNIITGRGMGVSIDFGLAIVKALLGEEAALRISSTIQHS